MEELITIEPQTTVKTSLKDPVITIHARFFQLDVEQRIKTLRLLENWIKDNIEHTLHI